MSYLKKYLHHKALENADLSVISYLAAIDYLHQKSPLIADSIIKELKAQRSHLKLIASENYSSLAVQLAMGNLLTDKYAEGYPGHRFYAGCENVDACENEAIEQVKKLFGAEHAYVQPHSGADANLIAFWSIITQKIQNKHLEKLGDKKLEDLNPEEYEQLRKHLVNAKVLGMSLDSGGHLTHGFKHNISSKMMQAFSYRIDPKTEQLDYASIAKAAKECRPDILLAGYSAYSRRINFAKMRQIADDVGAVLMVDMAHFAGLVAGKVFQGEENPIAYAQIVTSTTHKTLRGPRGGLILCTKEYADMVNKGCPLAMGGPLPHVIASKAIAFQEANTTDFEKYSKQIVANAKELAACFMKENIHIMSHGTDNHLMVVDVSSFNISGRQAEDALLECGICLNRNAIFNDPNGAWYTSGVRIGTPAVTSLGMKESQMRELGAIIIQVLKNTKATWSDKTNSHSKAKYQLDDKVKEKCKKQVVDLLKDFPLYPQLIIE